MRIGIIILSVAFVFIFWPSADANDVFPVNSFLVNPHFMNLPLQKDQIFEGINYPVEQSPRINISKKLDSMLIGRRILDKSI